MTSPSPTEVATFGTASATPTRAMKPIDTSAISTPARRSSRLRLPLSSTKTGVSPAPATFGLRGGGEDGAGHEDSHTVGGRALRGRSLMDTAREAHGYLVLLRR